MKILITGGSGLLGQYVNRQLGKNHQILTMYNSNRGNCINFNSVKIELSDSPALISLVKNFNPDCIIHLAALASPMLQEGISHKQVYDINVGVTALLASLAEEHGIRLIYTSTDLVYAGYRGTMLKEDAKLIPITLYAETKLMGEVKIQSLCSNHVILRTSLMYGIGLNHCMSHFHYMVKQLESGQEVKLFTDQIRTPLSYANAASIIGEIADNPEIRGIYNFGGRDRLSRFDMGEILCTLGGYNKNLLVPSSCKDIPNYPAVEDVSLNTQKLQNCGVTIHSFEHEVIEILAAHKSNG